MYNQRDIVLISIPFTDLSSKKRRPVIIISNDNYNQTNLDIIIVAITSNTIFSNEFCININISNMESGVLPCAFTRDKKSSLNEQEGFGKRYRF